MKKNAENFDLTDDKIIGKSKPEAENVQSICALNPKTWSCMEGVKNTKKCKGVSSVVVKNQITHADYKHTLDTGETLTRDVMRFQSIRQEVYTVVQSKKALNTFYDKFHMVDQYNNVPYGYIDGSNTGEIGDH